MNDSVFETLEIGRVIDLAVRHVQTGPGRRKMLAVRPLPLSSEVIRQLDLTSECVAWLSSGNRFSLSGIEDPDPILAQLHVEGTRLEPKQILALEELISVSKDLRATFKGPQSQELFPLLSRITGSIPDMRHILGGIKGKILPTGEIDDHASPGLRSLRRELTARRTRVHRLLESILRAQARAVQEEIITFRNGRFVIPIRTDSRSQVPGVVHGLSSSGQTTFVEPLAVIDQNNELVRLREQEEIEISRILLSITESLRENIDALEAIVKRLSEFDFIQAKAAFAVEFNCVRPQIIDGRKLVLKDARHLLLEHSLISSGGKSVPISLTLDEDHHVLVISGPNAGGKTVIIKTLGLISTMAQMGFHVPAAEALLPIFDRVFADIGDQQSITANLSTFTAHMRNVAEMSQCVVPSAFVLLDEAGTGTDPDEGAALAIAIVDYFRRIGCITVATTHYPALKLWASQTPGVLNASVEFDEATLRPTYRLIVGVAGTSSGLEIARRIGVGSEILDHAASLVEPAHARLRDYLQKIKETLDEQEELNAALARERAALFEEQSRLESESARCEEARKVKFEGVLAHVVRQFTEESERLVSEIKERIEADRIRRVVAESTAELRKAGRKLRQATEFSNYPTRSSLDHLNSGETSPAPAKIREGDHVKIRSLNREGHVESIQDETYVVMIGSLRYRADGSDLIRISGPRHENPQHAAVFIVNETPDKDVPSELNVIGLTADEAKERVDKFLDEAFLAGIENLRIIHGHGKGILKRAIAQFLSDHPQVERFNPAAPEQGGGGTTLVELRK